MAKKDLNEYIKKSHIKALEKFELELQEWARETGEEQPTLYEDANTSYTLSNLDLVNGKLLYLYDGRTEKETIVCMYTTGKYYEDELYGIMDFIKFHRRNLRRAKKYWAMDPEKLDAIQDGEAEDIEDNDD